MKNGGFNFMVGGKNGSRLASGAKDFVDEMGDGSLSGRTGYADESEVTSGVTVVCSEQLDFRAF